MKAPSFLAVVVALAALSQPACYRAHSEEKAHEEHHKIVATSPLVKDVVITQPYVCQIRSQCNIEVSALVNGRIEAVHIKEGQAVKQGDVMFKLLPILYQTRLDAEGAKVRLAEIKLRNAENLASGTSPVVSQQDVAMHRAELGRPQAKLAQAQAELNFTDVKAQFDGIVDRLLKQQGTSIKEGETLTTLSDNSVMWVYFNVPEARYFEYKALQDAAGDTSRLKLADSWLELVLADGTKFDLPAGKTLDTVTVEGVVNFETGNFKFRADFDEPEAPSPPRPDRHRAGPPEGARRRRHSPAGRVRDPRQAVRLGRRRGQGGPPAADHDRARDGGQVRHQERAGGEGQIHPGGGPAGQGKR